MYKKYFRKFLFIVLAFVLFAQPAFAIIINSQPENVSVSAIVIDTTSNPIDNNSGGGSITSVIFSGDAYPGAIVHLWKGGIPKSTVVVGNDGHFSITISEVYSPTAFYSLYAIDKKGLQSLLLNYPVVVKSGYVTNISGIRFAPTIATDKTEVKYGDPITVFGYAMPNEALSVVIKGFPDKVFYTSSKPDGTYSLPVQLPGMKKGNYSVYVKYSNDKRISKVIQFVIGDANVLVAELTNNIPGDCNADQVINLIDFSVAAFWYQKENPPLCVDTNKDKIINLIDFSILAFYWTG